MIGLSGLLLTSASGAKTHCNAGGARFERRVFPGFVSEFGVAGRGDGHCGGERCAFVDAHARARFEIGADDQRNLGDGVAVRS